MEHILIIFLLKIDKCDKDAGANMRWCNCACRYAFKIRAYMNMMLNDELFYYD